LLGSRPTEDGPHGCRLFSALHWPWAVRLRHGFFRQLQALLFLKYCYFMFALFPEGSVADPDDCSMNPDPDLQYIILRSKKLRVLDPKSQRSWILAVFVEIYAKR
jgi:hypothetical protein